jgi:hypothetical protein
MKKCSVCGGPYNGGIESVGILVCKNCGSDDAEREVILNIMKLLRGFTDGDGKPTKKARRRGASIARRHLQARRHQVTGPI